MRRRCHSTHSVSTINREPWLQIQPAISSYFLFIFASPKENIMATTTATTSKGKYWLYFLISFVIFMLMLIFMNQWFWVAMPFMLTYLVLALGYM